MTYDRPHSRRYSWLLACLLVVLPSAYSRAQSDAPAPVKKQLPADARAFKAACSTTDPEQRLAAMRAFIHDYPKSNRGDRAQTFILTTLLDNFPQRAAEIDSKAKLVVKRSGKGLSRANEEVYVAYLLAEAGAAGVDLPAAEKFAKDAVDHLSESAYDEASAKTAAKYKMPAPKPAELHKEFANTRADALAILADVYLRQGRQALAAPLVAEAYALDPLVDDVNSQRGRLALLDHNDALALDAFERAQLVGAVSPADRETMMQLYRQAHGGSDAGFTAAMDALYAQLFPPPFAPGKPQLAKAGHTVLLELFTGSACSPCVGGDLAVEGLLEAYPRSEIVALAFDQHIPEPDPLANPDSVARADFYSVASTPNYVLDGKLQPFYGGDRDGSRELYDNLAKAVDSEAALPTGVQLKLSAVAAAGGLVRAQAVVTLPAIEDIEKALTAKPKSDAPATEASGKTKKPSPAATPAPTPDAALPSKPHLIVNFALVEDDVRYSGENGVRFHRMVVRALAKPADAGFPVDPAATVTVDASFDPAAISRALASYLDGYEQQNDRFGKIKFLTKDMTMQPSYLAIAAWVQDSVTHRVLQTALIPVDRSQEGAL